MSKRPFWREHLAEIAVGVGNVFVIGLGYGVPVLAIVLGVPVGWQVARHTQRVAGTMGVDAAMVLRRVLAWGLGLALVTLAVTVFVWAPLVPAAADPAVDAAEFGIPLVLFGSQASVIAWLVLMMVVSPLLQFAAVATGGALALVKHPR